VTALQYGGLAAALVVFFSALVWAISSLYPDADDDEHDPYGM
jgi:hypothetical protein